MRRHLTRLLAVGLVLCGAPALAAEGTAEAKPPPADPYALAAKIDQHLNAQLKEHGVTPAPKADDANIDLVIGAPDARRGRGRHRAEEKPAGFRIGHYETPFSADYIRRIDPAIMSSGNDGLRHAPIWG